MRRTGWVAAALFSVGMSSMCLAQVTGTIKLEGDAPEVQEIDMSGVKECADKHADPVMDPSVIVSEDHGLANVIVGIETDDAESLGGTAPTTPVTIDQEGCMYHPHVLTMTVGQPLLVKNSDAFLHNVHSLSEINPEFNFGQPNTDPGKAVGAMKAAERFKVKCDVHPWMSAYIEVFEHPFHAVSDEKGHFEIAGKLPDGEYAVSLWHERFGEKEATIEVKDGKAELSVSFSAEESASADPVTPRTVLVSVKADCDPASGCCESDAPVAAQSTAQPQARAE